jgi:Putative beta-lactamase-inhibitor-like, PepSY-like
MKNTILVILSFAWCADSAIAQKMSDEKIPSPVIQTFKSMFPDAMNISWEMEEAHTFEADFKNNTGKHSAAFNAEGQWIETETEMKVSDLPIPVKEAIAKEFQGYKTEEACLVDHAKHGICYEAEIEKGKESYEILLSSKGDLLSKKIEKEEDKEEDED